MNIKPMSVRQIAARMISMTGSGVDVAAIADGYRATAKDFRAVAIKAAGAKSGKFRGYTTQEAMRLACNADELAVSVPAAIREIGGAP